MHDDNQGTWLQNPSLLTKVAESEEKKHSSRLAENKAYLRAYWDRPVMGSVDYTRPYRELAVFQHLRDQHGNNLTAEVVDAAVAIVCRDMSSEVYPMGADHKLEMGCKEASRLIEGVFDNSNFSDLAAECARDGMTADIGPVKGYVDKRKGEIKFDRLDPLLTFPVKDGTSNPRTVITQYPASRDYLRATYPKHWDRIKGMAAWSPPNVVGVDQPGGDDRDGNTLKVCEAWAASLGEGNHGRHSICVGDVELEGEEWTHEITPVFWFRWGPDFRGFGGRSLARIVGKFDSANRRLMRIVYAGLAGAIPKILAHEDSEVDGISDVEYELVRWSGQLQPQIVIPQAVSPAVIDQLERNRNLAFAEGGVNQGMATGNAPARYTSGAAQREYVDIANQRLLRAQKQWERFYEQAAEVVVMLAAQAKTAHVRIKGAQRYTQVSFPDIPRDKFKIDFGLTSGLSLTPAGRKQDLADLKEMEVIDVAEVARSLNLPDTRAIADRLNAPRDLVMQQISMALDQGIFTMPSAFQGPALNDLIRIGGEEYQRALLQGTVPPANMEVLRRVIRAAEARVKPAQPAPVAGVAPVAGAPADPNAPQPAAVDPNADPNAVPADDADLGLPEPGVAVA